VLFNEFLRRTNEQSPQSNEGVYKREKGWITNLVAPAHPSILFQQDLLLIFLFSNPDSNADFH